MVCRNLHYNVNRFFSFFNRKKTHLGLLEKIAGGVKVLLGRLIFFNKMIEILGYLQFLNKFSL
jgi:hypothetical protein